jgi:peptidoglycan/LPS O-acetylase OafA/YrhL
VFFGRFYFRRTLRIFPLYYAYLLILAVSYFVWAAPPDWPQVRPYALLYAINFGMIGGEVSSRDTYGHLWTLSVEEQFYLIWPLFVWLCSRRALLMLAVALVLAGPLVRFGSGALFGWNVGQIYVSTLSHADAFALGALIALGGSHEWLRRSRSVLIGALVVTAVIGLVIARANNMPIRTLGFPEGLGAAGAHIWGYTLLNAIAALLIICCLRGELRFLGTPALAYLGRISYGIYVFQRPIKGLYLAHFDSTLLGLIAIPVASALAAAISYHLFEMPILRFRDKITS